MSRRSFPWSRTFILGFGFFGISIVWPIFNSFIPPMLEQLGLTSLVIGFIMTWDNIINMFFQPWVGARSDRTRTRFGRRKPWLMVGAPIAAVFFLLVPFVRENFILIALAIFGTNIGMALFRSPTVAYLGDLFQPYILGDCFRKPDSIGISAWHWGNDWCWGDFYVSKDVANVKTYRNK